MQVFLRKYCKVFKNSFFIQHLRWLLLKAILKVFYNLRYGRRDHGNIFAVIESCLMKFHVQLIMKLFLRPLNLIMK